MVDLGAYTAELIFALVSAGLLGYCKHLWNQKQELEKLQKKNENQQYRQMILDEIEPIHEELRRAEAHIKEVQNKMENSAESQHQVMYDDLQKIQDHNDKNFALIINSYKYRLIQLCKTHLKDGYITSADYEQVSEMYNLYHGLGGNGQAEDYYKKVQTLPINDKKGEDN